MTTPSEPVQVLPPITLGREERAQRSDVLRDGALEVLSRYGIAPEEALLIEAIPKRPGRALCVGDAEGVVALAMRRVHPEAAVAAFALDAYVGARIRETIARNGGGIEVLVGADLPGIPPLPALPADEQPEGPGVGEGDVGEEVGTKGADEDGEPERDSEGAAAEKPSQEPHAGAPKGSGHGAVKRARKERPALTPAEPRYDTILLVLPDEGLLARELVEEAHDALVVGGKLLVAASRHPKLLKTLLDGVFGRCDRQGGERKGAQLFRAQRASPATRRKDRRRLLRRTVRGFEVVLASRAGVFAKHGVDAGTRALAERCTIAPGARVLDLGCGTGVLGIVARKLGAASALLVDSSARAVELAAESARRSGVADGTEVLLREDLEGLPRGFDVVLANPPYFADFRIARSFTAAAFAYLKPGGILYLVAKAAEQHREVVAERFGAAEAAPAAGGYGIITATR